MQFKAIEYFITLAETGSFSLAAEKLFLSQPALSQHIRKLELEIGATLFDRRKHPVELTPSGVLFLQEGKRLLQIYEQFLDRVALIESCQEEPVRFGISPFYSRYYLPKLLPPLVRSNPSIKFEIVENYSYVIEQMLIDRKLDFCMVPLLPQNPQLVYEPVYYETILLAVPQKSFINRFAIPSESGLPSIDLQITRDVPYITLKTVQKFTNFSKQLCEQAGFTPNTIFETMNWDTLNMLVSTGLGIGFVPDILIHQVDESIRPCYYHLLPRAQRVYTIAHRKGDALSSSAQTMVRSFRESFRDFSVDL